MKTKLFFARYSWLLLGTFLLFSCQTDDFNDTEKVDKILNEEKDTLVELPSGAAVLKNGKQYTWQGDILLSEQQLNLLAETGTPIEPLCEPNIQALDFPAILGGVPREKLSKVCAVNSRNSLWTMVRFVYAPTGFDIETQLAPSTKLLIQKALRHWETYTNIRFYNATGEPTRDSKYNFDYPYIFFCNGTANNSYVGRVGGKQVLHLVRGERLAAAIHEIGHAIGLYHEQCRYDRDRYITINFSNIESGAESNFRKITTNYYNMGSFDFSSIMLYDSYAYARDSNIPTMTKKDGTIFWENNCVSAMDRRFANSFYLPLIARSDTYYELDTVMYDNNNVRLSKDEIRRIQTQLNNGVSTPPANGRIKNEF